MVFDFRLLMVRRMIVENLIHSLTHDETNILTKYP